MIAVDIGPSRVETISYDLASEEDLDSTVKQIEVTGQRAVKATPTSDHRPTFKPRPTPASPSSGRSTSSAPTPASAPGRSAGR